MGSKVQQERFEKALKQLLRQTENKHCVHCGVLGPTYVVAKYGIFICTQCSSVQRDFARCKSVSMSKFDAEEVEIMKKQGNSWAWKSYLAEWSESKVGRPVESSRDPEKLKKWIRDVFEDKKFYKEPSADNHSPQPTSSSVSSVSAPPPQVAASTVAQSSPAPVQATANKFDPFGSMEIPAATTIAAPQSSSQPPVATFDPFAASSVDPVPAQQISPSDEFDPFAVAPSQLTPTPTPAPANPTPTPAPTTINPEPPAAKSRGALPEDMFSFAFEPSNEVTPNGNTFSSNPAPAAPTPIPNSFPQQPNNMYFQPQMQQFQPQFPGQQQQQQQQQWQGQGQIQGQGQVQPQQQYMYGIPQQQFGGAGFAYGGQYGQVPQQMQPQFGQNNFASQQQGFGAQAYPPQGQGQGQGQFENPQMFQAPVNNASVDVKQSKDEFDFFGDLMTGIGNTKGVQGTAQLGQPKAEGNPFA